MTISFPGSSRRDERARGVGVTAVLGPTNTGKTHLAIERMLAHSSGIMGVPLRLLAREIYNKIAEAVGTEAVALVTGEEKIKPPNPRFWISTVEAMPRDLDVAFLAIDEIQLGADLERGHVFTDRILNRRGREETLVLGAATMRPLIEKLLPGANIVSRPRLSQLTHLGDRKITRLPRRSAIVAFSADEVYAVAELIRRQRGGAAVVLGALSPRTRNAQVALFQSGDVDYLVATDAIGMGLNLDVEHIAFASDRKFDGYQFRQLNTAELGQIAGRAGRATRNGTFGTTGRCAPFAPDVIQALESHRFEPVKMLQWRNSALDFSSLGALQASLATIPNAVGLTRAPLGEDILVLEHATRDDEVRALALSSQSIERLWEVCQVPDYRKVAPATHAELVVTLYGFLQRKRNIPVDWFARQVAQAERTDGDIDTLSNRIAHIRTWTFAANRADWLADPEHWQGITRSIEDKLSDALHQRLTERFVDRRTSVLVRRLRENAMLETDITRTGEVVVEGHPIGRLIGFQFAADPSAAGPEAKALRAAAQKALAGEIETRAARLQSAGDDQFVLASDGAIRWTGEPIGKLLPGDDVLHPRLRLIADERLNGASRDAVQARIELWLKTHLEKVLAPLFALIAAEDVTGIARGVAFQLVESLGVLERHRVTDDLKALDQAARATLRKYGVRFGAYHVYLPALLKPAPRVLAAHLWALKNASPDVKGVDELPHVAASGRTSIPANKEISKLLYRTVGYRVCGERAVRVDILERLADLIRPLLAWRPNVASEKPVGAVDGSGFTVTMAMTSLTGASPEDFASILRSLGYRMERRPKPPEQPQTPSEAPSAMAAAIPSEDGGAGGFSQSGSIDPDPDDRAAEGKLGPSVPDAPGQDQAGAPIETAQASAIEPIPSMSPAASALPAAPDVGVAAPPNGKGQDEQEFIEVWRPGRPEERRHRRPPRRNEQQAARDAPRPAVSAEAAPERPLPQPVAERKTPGPAQPDQVRRGRHATAPRPSTATRPKGDIKPRDPLKASGAPNARRDSLPDPNSPFAKLAALKAQLEAAIKERR